MFALGLATTDDVFNKCLNFTCGFVFNINNISNKKKILANFYVKPVKTIETNDLRSDDTVKVVWKIIVK